MDLGEGVRVIRNLQRWREFDLALKDVLEQGPPKSVQMDRWGETGGLDGARRN